ncbi:hypothetical protein [Streptomyces hundungensis]|uniref:hypothetical protein n=1 Tax=Streptomyces hundungensis TaxID=1077946 RepID=UPI000EAAA39B|nr:hypothetical protein [Streptomyces hundungensis]
MTKRVRQRIVRGVWPAGTRLFLAPTARDLGLPMRDVKEAFIVLSREGLLTPARSSDAFRSWVVAVRDRAPAP